MEWTPKRFHDYFDLGHVHAVPLVKRSVSETDRVQCEQEQVLCCVAGITSFKNGAK